MLLTPLPLIHELTTRRERARMFRELIQAIDQLRFTSINWIKKFAEM